MAKSGIGVEFCSLPEEIPIFPLTGALLLPGGQLPLNIFEPRYLKMVDAALGAGRWFGMIQPDQTNTETVSNIHPLFNTGCLLRIHFYVMRAPLILIYLGQEEVAINRPIEEYVHHYETLKYDTTYIDQQHKRHKRSTPTQNEATLSLQQQSRNQQHVDLEFSAHGRIFNLRLKRDYSVFHNDLEIEDGAGNSILSDHDLSHIYEGYLETPDDGLETKEAQERLAKMEAEVAITGFLARFRAVRARKWSKSRFLKRF